MGDGSKVPFGQRGLSLRPMLGLMGAWLDADRKRRWWVLVLFIAAFIVRVRWNLTVHPFDQYLYSDMKGYLGRADGVLDNPFSVREYDAFFPFGTTWMLAGIKFLFGRDNITAIAVIFAFYVLYSKRGLTRYAPETVLFSTCAGPCCGAPVHLASTRSPHFCRITNRSRQ